MKHNKLYRKYGKARISQPLAICIFANEEKIPKKSDTKNAVIRNTIGLLHSEFLYNFCPILINIPLDFTFRTEVFVVNKDIAGRARYIAPKKYHITGALTSVLIYGLIDFAASNTATLKSNILTLLKDQNLELAVSLLNSVLDMVSILAFFKVIYSSLNTQSISFYSNTKRGVSQ